MIARMHTLQRQVSPVITTTSFSDCQGPQTQTVSDKTMLTYTLSFPADNDEFVSVDDARDVAFEVAQETGAVIYIYENFGASSNKIEEVAA